MEVPIPTAPDPEGVVERVEKVSKAKEEVAVVEVAIVKALDWRLGMVVEATLICERVEALMVRVCAEV